MTDQNIANYIKGTGKIPEEISRNRQDPSLFKELYFIR